MPKFIIKHRVCFVPLMAVMDEEFQNMQRQCRSTIDNQGYETL